MTMYSMSVWEFIKAYRSYIFTVVITLSVTLGCYFLVNREKNNILSLLKKQQLSHEEEVEKIEKAYEDGRKEHAANLLRLQNSLDEIQKKHDDDMRKLETKKVEKVEKLVKSWRNDPTGVEMANQLGKITGFQVVVPGN